MADISMKKGSNINPFEWLVCIFYMWYFLPAVGATLSAGFYKYIFFGCFFAGLIGLFLFGKLKINMITVAVFSYFIVFTVLYLLKVGHADRHIRISFTFWGTAILYFGLLDNEARLRVGKFLLALYIITCITSSLGVILNNSAARTIADASGTSELRVSYKRMNIANIYLFQSMVMFVPLCLCLPKTPKTKFWGMMALVVIFFVLSKASFFISIVVFLFAIVFSLVIKQKNIGRMIAILTVFVLFVILYATGYDLLTILYSSVTNVRFAERIHGIRELIYSGQKVGDAGMRWRLYTSSFETFVKNPFGIGVNYSYKTFDMGIGHHSQFLDDLARYGVAAIAFYGVFFAGYYKYLKQEWKKAGNERIAAAICAIYFVFLILNIGFRSGEESIAVFCIVPTIPLIIAKRNEEAQLIKSGDDSRERNV